jgi:hypothetical protein
MQESEKLVLNGDRALAKENENIPKVDGGDGCTTG